jgi:Dolichyl-phosphate-mannose-protein mannosyltransferase
MTIAVSVGAPVPPEHAMAATPTVQQLALLVLAHVVGWTLAPGLAHWAPPIDTLEVYMWSRDWILVSNKHPNMAGWLLAAVHGVVGVYGWSAYILAQLCTALTILFVYLLGREVTDARSAALGAALLCTVGYFTWFTPQYNANVVSLPFWAGFILAVWRARHSGTIANWVLVGLVGAGVVYCKVSGALLLLVAVGYALFDPRLRRQLLTPGPWIAAVVCAALFTPALIEMQRQNFQVLDHAAAKSAGRANPHIFLGAQILMCAVMLLILAVTMKRALPKVDQHRPDAKDAYTFVLVFALAPMGLLLVQSVLLGTRLHDLWGIPMGSLFGLVAVMTIQRRGFNIDGRRLLQIVWFVVIATPLIYFAVKTWTGGTKPQTTSWPQRQISKRLEALWTEETRTPLKLVAGDAWEAGLVALTAQGIPSLLIDMEPSRAPWITADRITRDGLLVVWPFTYKDGDHLLRPLTKDCRPKSTTFNWPGRPNSPPLKLTYCILPPK